MRSKFTLIFIACMLSFGWLIGQTQSIPQHATKKGYSVSCQQLKSNNMSLDFKIQDFKIADVIKNGKHYSEIQFDGNVKTNRKGWAELPYLSSSIQLPENKNVSFEVTDSEFDEFDLQYSLLPSRGTIYRNQDPNTLPYEIDPSSLIDAWYPTEISNSSQPFIFRDVRGENVYIYPFQYNAAQKKLRVYKKISIKISENTTKPINPLEKSNVKVNLEMDQTYESLFINYKDNKSRWTNEIGENGEILVVHTSRDVTVLQPWITWKKEKGFKVTTTQVAVGTNVKTTIKNAYTTNPNILYVLLVGDWADLTSDLGTSGNAPMDPLLGCVVGTDDYADIIVGRFSASTTTHVTTQADKAINYEKNPEINGTWYAKGLVMASDEGAGIGDDGESDQQHMENIKTLRLIPDGYTVTTAYDPGVSAAQISTAINGGLGVINYVGHGSATEFVTSGFSTSDAANLTNAAKLPFIFSVACVNGEFHTSTDCLAEGLLKKSGGGALVTLMSTINQPWAPPMRGQDYANDLLVQGHTYTSGGTSTTYGRTTFGSISLNAKTLMVAESGQTDDWETYKTWCIFGDPTVQVRTEAPKAITVGNQNVTPGTFTTNIKVDGVNFQNALVSLYKAGDPAPFSGLTDASGNITITHTLNGTVKLTVTGFNLATYSQDKVIANPNPPIADFSANQTTVVAGSTVNFTDLSANYPSSWAWDFTGGTPTSSAVQNPAIVYNTVGTYTVSLTSTNGAGTDSEIKTGYIIVNPITQVPTVDFTANQTSISVGQSVDFTDLSTNSPSSWLWTFVGGTPATSDVKNPTGITYNAPGTYAVTLQATNSIGSADLTKALYITVIVPDPCTAGSNNTSYEHISNVQVGSINNSSAASSYTDFSSSLTNMIKDTTYPITITLTSGYATDQILIWVDWNNNADFSDANELIYTSATGVGPFTTNIIPPVDAINGIVRMRIRLHDTNEVPNASACGVSGYGEVEDYRLNISTVSSVEDQDDMNLLNVYPNPTNGTINIEAVENIEMVEIYDVLGKTSASFLLNNKINTIDLSNYDNGIYILKIKINNQYKFQRVIINK